MAEVTIDPRGSEAPNQIDEQKRQKLLELVRGRALARPTDLAEDEVMVWPSLVVVEAVCATVFLAILTLLSIFVSAPLTEHANPNQTPNPSKAPWYFLNLQELLLHMDAGLAGVIVPTTALVLIAAIPYIDRSPLGVGILGTSAKGRKIALFSAIWTTVVISVYIVADEFIGDTRSGWGIGIKIINWTEVHIGDEGWYADIVHFVFNVSFQDFVGKIVYPTIVMVLSIAMLMIAVRLIFRPTRREMIIALFTGFFTAYWVLSMFGTSFRGHGQNLTWPWDLPRHH